MTCRCFPFIVRAAVLLTAAAVMFAAFLKVDDIQEFRRILIAQRLIGENQSGLTAWVITGAELGIGCVAFGLALQRPLRLAAIAALMMALLFAAFAIYSAALVVFPPPKPVPCGCGFSPLPVSDWAGIAARNGAITTTCAIFGLSVLRVAATGREARPVN